MWGLFFEKLCENFVLSKHVLLHDLDICLRFLQKSDLFYQELSQTHRGSRFQFFKLRLKFFNGLGIRCDEVAVEVV